MPYNEEVSTTKPISEALKGKFASLLRNASKKDLEQYEFYLWEACKLTGDKYMKMHGRLCRAFTDAPAEYVIRRLKEWVHYAEKQNNSGMAFNTVFKQWRERQTKV